MTLDDRTYYLRRALEEDAAARIAACEAAREVHLQLAAAYRERCGSNGEPARAADSRIVADPGLMAPAA